MGQHMSETTTTAIPTTDPSAHRPGRRRIRSQLQSGIVVAITLALFGVFAIAIPGFADPANIRAFFYSAALVGIVAVGLSFITLAGRIFSLAIGANVAISTIFFAANLHLGAWPALLLTLGLGAAIGVVQGVLIGIMRTDPIVTTIAASAIIYGIGQAITRGRTVVGEGDPSIFTSNVLGIIPFQILTFIVVALVGWWLHRHTAIGRLSQLLGLNEDALRISGIRVWPLVMVAFIAASMMASLSGALIASDAGQGTLQLGASLGFDGIIAVIVGGVSVRGGIGNPANAAVGALLIALISNALILAGLSYDLQLVFKGVLVIVAVVVSELVTARSRSGRS
jgi:ribose/xylose/arabinose/galactoside ABC-type transport system permease subunit